MERFARILVAGLWHETNTFSVVTTAFDEFVSFQYAEGNDVRLRYEGTNTEIGGMIDASDELGFDLCFALFAGAVPSGVVEASAFSRLLTETSRLVIEAGPVDGALLALHGAMVAKGSSNAEVDWVVAVRDLIGRSKPVVATFDLHANLSQALVEVTDALVGYDTYPHEDMADRGRDASRILAQMIRTGRRPVKVLRKLPLLTVPQTQGTDGHPTEEIYAALRSGRKCVGVVAASVAMGFPYSDRDDLGVAVVAYGESRPPATFLADRLATTLWNARDDFVPELLTPRDAVTVSMRTEATTVLVDVADNVGGGAPGDGTILLSELLAAAPPAAAIVLWDPDTVRRAVALGVGASFTGLVGGRADRLHGPPVAIEGTIVFARPVRYQRRSSYMTGQVVDLGLVAVIACGGLRIMLTERRSMPFDRDHLSAAGISLEKCRALVVKSAIAWKAGFAELAARHLFVDTPGICASNLTRFHYTRGAAELFPLNLHRSWSAETCTEH